MTTARLMRTAPATALRTMVATTAVEMLDEDEVGEGEGEELGRRRFSRGSCIPVGGEN